MLTCCVSCYVQGNPGTDGIPGAKGSAVSITEPFSLNDSDTVTFVHHIFTVKADTT